MPGIRPDDAAWEDLGGHPAKSELAVDLRIKVASKPH